MNPKYVKNTLHRNSIWSSQMQSPCQSQTGVASSELGYQPRPRALRPQLRGEEIGPARTEIKVKRNVHTPTLNRTASFHITWNKQNYEHVLLKIVPTHTHHTHRPLENTIYSSPERHKRGIYPLIVERSQHAIGGIIGINSNGDFRLTT